MSYLLAETSHGKVSYRRLGNGPRKILFFHGFPGSSKQIDIFKNEVEKLGLDVLCFDRPGYYHTEIKTSDTLSVTTDIAMELVSMLGWTDFEIVTVSGGTPFGITIGLKYPMHVKAIRVICGLGDLNVPSVRKNFSALSLWGLKILPIVPSSLIVKALKTNPTRRNPVMDFFIPASKPDLEIARHKGVGTSLSQSLLEALQQGFLGPKQDTTAFMSNWSVGSLNLSPPIHFWHGDQDHVISNGVSSSMASLFPGGKMTLVKNQGHVSLPVTSIGQILNFDFSKST